MLCVIATLCECFILDSVGLFLVVVVSFFFFKQKTAYEMRISDWSSDVCSSDLRRNYRDGQRQYHRPGRARGNPRESTGSDGLSGRRIVTCLIQTRALHTDRKSVV